MHPKRELVIHKQENDEVNQALIIQVMDDPGPGGAHHHYRVEGPITTLKSQDLHFQWGHVDKDGVNGITNDALLAILEDRLASYQGGSFHCFDNESALHHIRTALFHLKQRTRKRMDRGVEGRYVA
ncbi:MAG TPA: hypothetical protein EYQ50_22145 [Verrucomicrobiales bacterium]|jgi:hypothetical protein|nr:hypothetical protein [Verrucomicrobiales bacterium]HIL72240.1 hypothetical protein [Verrucomicrobiota bacterium]